MIKGRDIWWEDEMEHAEHQIEQDGKVKLDAEVMDAEDPLIYIILAVAQANLKVWYTVLLVICFGLTIPL